MSTAKATVWSGLIRASSSLMSKHSAVTSTIRQPICGPSSRLFRVS